MSNSGDFVIENGVLKKYTGPGGDVVIPEGVTKLGREWLSGAFSNCRDLKSVTIPSSVTEIEPDVFMGCDSLTSVIIPEGVTSIGGSAFSGCSSLTNVMIPASVTRIGDSAFERCNALTSVTISDGVTSIGNSAFRGCSSLTSVTIPEGVISIGGWAFDGCKSLVSVTIPRSATEIGQEAFSNTELYRDRTNWKNDAFYLGDVLIKAKQGLSGEYVVREETRLIADGAFLSCTGLTHAVIPAGVTDIGKKAFAYCRGLSELTIPESVTSIGSEAFERCESLSSILIPGSVEHIGSSAFSDCELLEKAELSEGVRLVEGKMFAGCNHLRIVKLPSTVREICTDAFDGCEKLTEILVDRNNPAFSAAHGALFRNKGTELYLVSQGQKGKYTIPEGVTEIASLAFHGCSELTEVEIPESVAKICKEAFKECGLTNVSIPGSVKRIGEMAFFSCKNLSSVTLLEGVEEIDSKAFFLCKNLSKVSIPAGMKKIEWNAFDECPSLAQVVVAPGSESFSMRDGVVFSLDGSELLLCPGRKGGVYTIPEGVKRIGSFAFSNCRELTGVVLPRGIEQLSSTTFRGCQSLNSATVFDDYPGKNIGALFGYYTNNNMCRTYLRVNCLVTVRDAKSDAVRYQVLLVDESGKINDFLRYSYSDCAWGENASFDFRRFDEMFDGYKDITNRLMAAYLRLKYPVELEEKAKEKYRELIKRNGYKLFPDLIRESNTELIQGFLDLGAVSKTKIDSLIETATKCGNAEITAMLMDYKQKAFGTSKPSLRLSDKPIEDWEVKKEAPTKVWRYKGKETEVVFPIDVKGVKITGIADTVFKKPENYLAIEKIIIPEGYRSIGKDAFSGCSRLKEVVLPKSLDTLGENCFADCHALETINLPDSLTRIPSRAFFQCEKLTRIKMPKELISIGDEAFRDCISLKEIDLGKNFGLFGDKAFYLSGLETVIFRGKSCTAWSGMCFSYPRYVYTDGEIEALGIPRETWMPLSYLGLKNRELVNTADKDLLSGLTVYGCGKLKAFTTDMGFSEFVTALGGTYSDRMNKSVNLVVIYEIDPENTTIQRAQKQETAVIAELDFLKLIQNNEKPDLDAIRAQSSAIVPPPPSDDPFRPALVKKLWKYTELEDGTIRLDSYLGKETEVVVPPRIGDKSVQSIGESAFSPEGSHVSNRAGKKAICRVTIPESVRLIGGKTFEGCSELAEINLPAKPQKVDTNFMFCRCKKLASVTIPQGTLELSSGMFHECKALTSIEIPEGVTSIGWWAFYGCDRLTDLRIPTSVTKINKEAFFASWNPHCSVIIHAPAGSYAEQYAKENNIPFVAE